MNDADNNTIPDDQMIGHDGGQVARSAEDILRCQELHGQREG